MQEERTNTGHNPEIERDGKNQLQLIQLNRIFEAGGVTVDVSELKQLLMEGKDHTQKMEEYFQVLPNKQYKLIEKVLASQELAKWKQSPESGSSDVGAKSAKLNLIFSHADIKHDLQELKQALLKNQKYDAILEVYSDQYSGKEMKAINIILKSK